MITDTGINLSLPTTDELWHELRSRFDAALLIHRRPTKVKSDDALLSMWWDDCVLTERYGMAEYAVRHFGREMDLVIQSQEAVLDPDIETQGDRDDEEKD